MNDLVVNHVVWPCAGAPRPEPDSSLLSSAKEKSHSIPLRAMQGGELFQKVVLQWHIFSDCMCKR